MQQLPNYFSKMIEFLLFVKSWLSIVTLVTAESSSR